MSSVELELENIQRTSADFRLRFPVKRQSDVHLTVQLMALPLHLRNLPCSCTTTCCCCCSFTTAAKPKITKSSSMLFLTKNSMISFNLLELVQDCNSLATAYHPVPPPLVDLSRAAHPCNQFSCTRFKADWVKICGTHSDHYSIRYPKAGITKKNNSCMGPASSKLSWMGQKFKLAKNVTARQ